MCWNETDSRELWLSQRFLGQSGKGMCASISATSATAQLTIATNNNKSSNLQAIKQRTIPLLVGMQVYAPCHVYIHRVLSQSLYASLNLYIINAYAYSPSHFHQVECVFGPFFVKGLCVRRWWEDLLRQSFNAQQLVPAKLFRYFLPVTHKVVFATK